MAAADQQVRAMTAPWKHPLPKARRMKLGYWSGMRSAKNSTSSEAAGGSRLLRLTTT
jgi:hypothetical protein